MIINNKIEITNTHVEKVEKEHQMFREFTCSDYVENELYNSYSLRHYIPWTLENYKDWLPEYQENALSLALSTTGNKVFETFTRYCGYGYNHMTPSEINTMDKEMSKDISFIKDDIILYRLDYYDVFCNRCKVHDINENQHLAIPGFFGTGLVKENLLNIDKLKNKDTIIKIFAPKGTNGLYVNRISHRNEEEIILARNQKMKVLYRTKDGDKNLIALKVISTKKTAH